VLVPIAIPSGFVAAVVYDHEFRESVDERFPEIGEVVWASACLLHRMTATNNRGRGTQDTTPSCFPCSVDYVRKKVGFQEDLRKRARELEKNFISTQREATTGGRADITAILPSARGSAPQRWASPW
jgi:hypothetical protein